ncbi:tripartite ATP-independent transporter DctP family solute receptor [Caldalkalibacillus uzonensis]|uniref:Tripartite ATP-independent transporter DctP family solute receptor n=1 Tax=Caldalkalibacillus uzonensis TaxID=353224 RepID=A0ABU0CLS4_9BACI|nr:TRAP transporter substrate-binding protein [Caldalkalibacillus uzonensis]MDQ0337364.1 tripartite ATP-independent transporter DctP family solute receptor [Caldalkalibacillus uzonensis]
MRRYFRKTYFLTLILTLALIITGCGSDSVSEQGSENAQTTNDNVNETTRVIDVSLPLGPDSHHAAGIHKFGEELERLTDGRLTINPHYNNALGGEREVIEGMSINTIDAGISSTGPLGGFVKELFLFDLPYIFENEEHVYAVLDGEIGRELAALIEEEVNVKVLGWMENGFRHNTNSVRPLNHPDDLKGIKHRTQESQVQVDTWTALGADATPMAWPEVYTALQQGVIDSQENPIPTIYDVRFYEVQDYLNLTQHVYSPAPLMMSKELFDSFSPEDQEAILEAAAIATHYQRQVSTELTKELINELEEKGMTVTRPDLEPFRQAVQPVIETWAPEVGEEMIEKVINYEY